MNSLSRLNDSKQNLIVSLMRIKLINLWKMQQNTFNTLMNNLQVSLHQLRILLHLFIKKLIIFRILLRKYLLGILVILKRI